MLKITRYNDTYGILYILREGDKLIVPPYDCVRE